MIASFRHRGLKRFYEEDDARRLPADMIERIRAILTALDAARTIESLRRPTFRLHPLRENYQGFTP
jgi:proteic killer suppression protein